MQVPAKKNSRNPAFLGYFLHKLPQANQNPLISARLSSCFVEILAFQALTGIDSRSYALLMSTPLDPASRAQLLTAQKNEITEYHIYTHLAKRVRDSRNAQTLRKIGDDEKAHYEFWKTHTGTEVRPSRWKIVLYSSVSRLFGLTFGLKLMERGEEQAQINYDLIAASFSMAGSEYLSTKTEGEAGRAFKAALYTGAAYIITVFLLVLPFLILANYFVSLAITMATAVLIILLFSYYVSVAQDLDFKSCFFEMAGLSLGIAAFSFGVGYFVRIVLGVDV